MTEVRKKGKAWRAELPITPLGHTLDIAVDKYGTISLVIEDEGGVFRVRVPLSHQDAFQLGDRLSTIAIERAEEEGELD